MSLVNKYSVSEKDLYQLGIIELKKKTSSYFEQEKLKAASLKILKPYKVSFLDLGILLSEIKNGGYDIKYSESFSESEKQELNSAIQENSNVFNFYKNWWEGKGKKQKWALIIGVFAIIIIASKMNGGSTNTESSQESNYIPKTEIKVCSYCGKIINGSGVEGNYGEPYCDKYCFVDGN